MTKRNFKYVLDKIEPKKVHSKTGELIPNFKKVSSNLTTWSTDRSHSFIKEMRSGLTAWKVLTRN